MIRFHALAFVLTALTLVACGKKDDASGSTSTTSAAAKTGSCQKLANAGKCTEYSVKDDLTASIQKGGCEATSGTWSMTACPADKQFANCATSESKIFYYQGTQAKDAVIQVDEDFAKLDCDLMSGKLAVTAKPDAPVASAAPAATAPAATAKKQPSAGGPKKK